MIFRPLSLGLLAASIVLLSLSVFAVSGETTDACVAPSDDELIDLAIAEMVGAQPGSVSIPQATGPTIGLRLAPFPTAESYKAANPDCCLVVTEQTLTEGIRPEDAPRLNYGGSVRVQTTSRVNEKTHPDLYPSNVYQNVRVIDFDKYGKRVKLNLE